MNAQATLLDYGQRLIGEPLAPLTWHPGHAGTLRISTADRRAAERKLADLTELTSPPLVPCHLDFTARNLMRHSDGTVRLIDFEHSRYDLAARDLLRLATRIWPHRPDLEAAFCSTSASNPVRQNRSLVTS